MDYDVSDRRSDHSHRGRHGRQRPERVPDYVEIQYSDFAGLRPSRSFGVGGAEDAAVVGIGFVLDRTGSGNAGRIRISLVADSAGCHHYSGIFWGVFLEYAAGPRRHAGAGALVQELKHSHRCGEGIEGFRRFHGPGIPLSQPDDFVHWLVEPVAAVFDAGESADDRFVVSWAYAGSGRVVVVCSRWNCGAGETAARR